MRLLNSVYKLSRDACRWASQSSWMLVLRISDKSVSSTLLMEWKRSGKETSLTPFSFCQPQINSNKQEMQNANSTYREMAEHKVINQSLLVLAQDW